MIEFRIGEDGAGQRLDKFLRRALPGVPVSHLFKLLRTRQVRVNGARARAGHLLAAGDAVVVRGAVERLPGPSPPGPKEIGPRRAPSPQGIHLSARPEFRVLYEDDHVLACDKPAGLAVHTGTGIHGGTLVDQVRAYLGPRAIRNHFAASPAHRLDRDTSGVILVAKSRRAMVRLTEVFTAGEAEKRYLALAKGRFLRTEGVIDLALAEHQQTARSRRERGVKLQAAVTRYRVIAAAPFASLVECAIETGRTHQIRRHLAAIGHPVAGDLRYGDFGFNRELKARWNLRRMFLHAEHLGCVHPVHGGRLRVTAPLPEELRGVLRRAGLSPRGEPPAPARSKGGTYPPRPPFPQGKGGAR